MKFWLSHLPLEVWVDVYRYPWITREELGRIVDRFCNRKYVEYLQFYLHDWGKRTLNALWFDQSGLYQRVRHPPSRLYKDFPLTPVPHNIKSFERLSIEHFDMQAIAFLRHIRVLLTDVELELSSHNMEEYRIILTNLLPLLDGIHSFICEVPELPIVKQCFGHKLDKLKVFEIYDFEEEPMNNATLQATVNFLTDWVTSPGPKLGDVFICNDNGFSQQISLAIREQFLMANHPSTFALTLSVYPKREFAEFHRVNSIDEELHGVRICDGDFQITRHQANRDTELQEWIKNKKCRQGRIELLNATIGSLDAIMDVPGNEKEDRQPSTSKKA